MVLISGKKIAKELPEDLQKEFLLRLNSSFED